MTLGGRISAQIIGYETALVQREMRKDSYDGAADGPRWRPRPEEQRSTRYGVVVRRSAGRSCPYTRWTVARSAGPRGSIGGQRSRPRRVKSEVVNIVPVVNLRFTNWHHLEKHGSGSGMQEERRRLTGCSV